MYMKNIIPEPSEKNGTARTAEQPRIPGAAGHLFLSLKLLAITLGVGLLIWVLDTIGNR